MLRSYENRLFLESDSCEVYYIAAYLVFYLDNSFRTGKIEKEYRPYKYHLACAIKALEVGSQVIFGQGRKQRKEFEKLFALIKDQAKMERYLHSAVSCLDKAIKECADVPEKDRHRSKEITKELLANVSLVSEAQSNPTYLKVGDIVHCVVTSINVSFVHVKLKTEDSRNFGEIHISQISNQYIANLSDVISIADVFQAKIIKDFYESKFGWELTLLID